MKTMYKTEARVLRRRGYSFQQLSERLNISKSTASLWTSDVKMSQFGIDRINKYRKESNERGNTILHERKLMRVDIASNEAQRYIEKVPKDESIKLIILSLIYECEGSKGGRSICFTNSDPNLVQLFLSTFRSSFCIDEKRLKVRVHIHDYHNDEEIKNFWSLVTDIPLTRFYSSFKKPSSHMYKKDGYKGCVHISYHDVHLTRIIREFAKKFIKLYI